MQDRNSANTIYIKKTPFVFLKTLVVIQLFFGLLPILLAFLLNFSEEYNATAFARVISYNLLVVLIITTIQLFIIFASFLFWYVPTYEISPEMIVLKRGSMMHDEEIVPTRQIEAIAVQQGWLGKRIGYGSLRMEPRGEIKNVSDPNRLANLLREMDTAVSTPALTSFSNSKPTPQLLAEGENQHVEFKSSLLWDYHQQIPNKSLYLPVIKNVAAFMNSNGGIVIIGADDEGNILGLEPDFKVMKKKNEDGFENTFNLAFNQMIGAQFRQYVDLQFEHIDDKVICLLTVQPAQAPAYLTHNGKETFYIKTGNSSQPLTVSQATSYIQTRFTKIN